MIVVKFGGTSVGDAESIERAAEIVKGRLARQPAVVVSALGGPEQSLGSCGDRDYRRLAWSPDGAWLAFPRRDQASQLGIELASLETRERKTLTHPPAGILGDSSPSFSPDGKRLAFCRNLTEGVNDLYSIRLDGSSLKRLTFDNRDTMGLDWSSGGDSLVFSSSRAGIYSLWRVEYVSTHWHEHSASPTIVDHK